MAKVNIVRPGEGEILGSGAQQTGATHRFADVGDENVVMLDTSTPDLYATEISNEYAS